MSRWSSELINTGLDSFSSSVETDYLALSIHCVRDIIYLVGRGILLNRRQSENLSEKLLITVENIQELVSHFKVSAKPFLPALKKFYRILEKARVLVNDCSNPDWCRAAVFQIQDEEAFREILLEVGLCYNVIYEQAKDMDVWKLLLRVEDLRWSSTFLPASKTEVLEDGQTLQRRLEYVTNNSGSSSYDSTRHLARYLFRKLQCKTAPCTFENLAKSGAILLENETAPPGTWVFNNFIGSGSGASGVCSTTWLGIPCARKEFHNQVADDMFRKEAAILAGVNHPNIVKFLCCSNGKEKGESFIGMELMQMSLYDLIEEHRKVGVMFANHVARDIIVQIANSARNVVSARPRDCTS